MINPRLMSLSADTRREARADITVGDYCRTETSKKKNWQCTLSQWPFMQFNDTSPHQVDDISEMLSKTERWQKSEDA